MASRVNVADIVASYVLRLLEGEGECVLDCVFVDEGSNDPVRDGERDIDWVVDEEWVGEAVFEFRVHVTELDLVTSRDHESRLLVSLVETSFDCVFADSVALTDPEVDLENVVSCETDLVTDRSRDAVRRLMLEEADVEGVIVKSCVKERLAEPFDPESEVLQDPLGAVEFVSVGDGVPPVRDVVRDGDVDRVGVLDSLRSRVFESVPLPVRVHDIDVETLRDLTSFDCE